MTNEFHSCVLLNGNSDNFPCNELEYSQFADTHFTLLHAVNTSFFILCRLRLIWVIQQFEKYLVITIHDSSCEPEQQWYFKVSVSRAAFFIFLPKDVEKLLYRIEASEELFTSRDSLHKNRGRLSRLEQRDANDQFTLSAGNLLSPSLTTFFISKRTEMLRNFRKKPSRMKVL